MPPLVLTWQYQPELSSGNVHCSAHRIHVLPLPLCMQKHLHVLRSAQTLRHMSGYPAPAHISFDNWWSSVLGLQRLNYQLFENVKNSHVLPPYNIIKGQVEFFLMSLVLSAGTLNASLSLTSWMISCRTIQPPSCWCYVLMSRGKPDAT